MVEVVVALTKSDKRSDDVVPGAVAVVEGLVTKPMGERVDAEGGLLDEEDTEDTSVDKAALPVIPQKSRDSRGEDETHEDDDLDVVLVLPNDDGVLVQVGDVGTADALGVLLHNHPPKMAVEKTLANAVGVLVGVGVAVVGTVVAAPPADGALNSAAADECEEDAQWQRGIVRFVCPETMVTSCDAKTRPEVVDDGPKGCLPPQRCETGRDAAGEGDADDEGDLCKLLAAVLNCRRGSELTLSQLTCLYQFALVMGVSVMCGFLGSYLGLRFGSEVLAIGDGCLTYSGSTAIMPAVGWWEGMLVV